MKAKLTLSINEATAAKAKKHAKNTGRSLSELVESYLESITEETSNQQISPKLQKLFGAVKLPADFDEDAELRAYFEDKHL